MLNPLKLSTYRQTKTCRSNVARMDEWEPDKGSRGRRVLRLIVLVLCILAFFAAATAYITMPIPQIYMPKHHPHSVGWYMPGMSP